MKGVRFQWQTGIFKHSYKTKTRESLPDRHL